MTRPCTERPLGVVTVTARLRVDDDLAVDNVAYAVLPPPRKIGVLLVSPGNLFLEKVLRTDPQVSLEVRTPDQYQGGMGDADVVVLDSATTPRAGAGRFIFINTVPPDVPIEVLGRLERPTIMDWDRNHPVMRHVEFAKVTIEDAVRIRPLAVPGQRRQHLRLDTGLDHHHLRAFPQTAHERQRGGPRHLEA